MSYKRVLTIQDISCVGQCSLTVALPILSACGLETAIIPSAVLSTHTAGFSGYTFRDLTDDIPKITEHWVKENIKFDAIYTGYLGSTKQIDYVKSIFDKVSLENTVKIVDPAMADGGKLYPAFDCEYVEAMKELVSQADIVIPNITEACFLTDTEYKTECTPDYIEELISKLKKLGAKTAVITGVSYNSGKTGIAVSSDSINGYYEHDVIGKGCHGTGDVYASAFVGAYTKGKDLLESAKIAADYTVECIKLTKDDPEHWYGVKFELALPKLIEMLSK